MTSRIAIAASTLLLGTALSAVPALAQNSGNQRSCIHFGISCSDTPYPATRPATGEQSQYNGGQRSQRTGSAENTEHAQARSEALGSAGPGYAMGGPNARDTYYDYADQGPTFAGGPTDQGAIAWCQARFHSFDPETGTYLGFDGVRHSCP
jgi:hypothetical protein